MQLQLYLDWTSCRSHPRRDPTKGKMEAKCIYRNVVLCKESVKVTTFGRYRFRHVPFSLKIAQDVFQTKMEQTFEGCKDVVGIADEIVVFGKINEEHHRNMHAMLKRLQTFLGDSKLHWPSYSKPKNTDSSRLRGVPQLPVRPKLYRLHRPQALESIYLKQRLPPNSGRLCMRLCS